MRIVFLLAAMELGRVGFVARCNLEMTGVQDPRRSEKLGPLVHTRSHVSVLGRMRPACWSPPCPRARGPEVRQNRRVFPREPLA